MAPRLASDGDEGNVGTVVVNDGPRVARVKEGGSGASGKKDSQSAEDVDNSMWNELYQINAIFSPVSRDVIKTCGHFYCRLPN